MQSAEHIVGIELFEMCLTNKNIAIYDYTFDF